MNESCERKLQLEIVVHSAEKLNIIYLYQQSFFSK